MVSFSFFADAGVNVMSGANILGCPVLQGNDQSDGATSSSVQGHVGSSSVTVLPAVT